MLQNPKISVSRVLRRFVFLLYGCWVKWYIRRERIFRYKGLLVNVPPGVFHPGLYGSTSLFIDFLEKIAFSGKKVLEMGTGSGLPAIFAAQKGGIVTALDISPLAVQTAQSNAARNGVAMRVLQSDLWTALPPDFFEEILVNPPYYDKTPDYLTEYAFFAGEGLTYFDRFFAGLAAFLAPEGRVWMIVSENCNTAAIMEKGRHRGFDIHLVPAGTWWGERFMIVCCRRGAYPLS